MYERVTVHFSRYVIVILNFDETHYRCVCKKVMTSYVLMNEKLILTILVVYNHFGISAHSYARVANSVKADLTAVTTGPSIVCYRIER